jgi:membrane protein YdbS with pleckstrin-like domain
MPLEAILVIVLVLILLGVAPIWPYSRTWGPWPSHAAGLLLLILIVLLVLRA